MKILIEEFKSVTYVVCALILTASVVFFLLHTYPQTEIRKALLTTEKGVGILIVCSTDEAQNEETSKGLEFLCNFLR